MKRGIIIENIEVDDLQELIKEAIREELALHSDPNDPARKLLTREEAAEYLGITLPTLRDYVTSGRLRCKRIGGKGKVFFTLEDIHSSMK
jgi:excisionase family DNA binding protein